MDITIKLVKKIYIDGKYNFEEELFELEEIGPKSEWINLIHDLDSDYEEYYFDYYIIDKEGSVINGLEYDEFYGPVKFNVSIDSLTVEQLVARYGYNLEIIREDTGKGAVGDYIPSILEFLFLAANFYNKNTETINKHKAKITMKLTKDNKILKMLEEEGVTAYQMIKYLHSKEKLTIPYLQVAFPGFSAEEIKEIMPLFFFEYNQETKQFNMIKNEQIAPKYMLDLTAPQQFKLLHLFINYRERGIKLSEVNMVSVYNKFGGKFKKDLLFEILKELYINFNYTKSSYS